MYEHPVYLAAASAHERAPVETVGSDGTWLPLLRLSDGSRRTIYGLPRPAGDGDLAELASEVSGLAPTVTVLSPLGRAPEFADRLIGLGGELVAERPIALHRLAGPGASDPADRFARRIRRTLGTAARRGAEVSVGALEPWFGGFYRAAMTALQAAPIYHFDDPYFEALGAMPHYLVCVRDEHGVAAAALFLHEAGEAYYHLGGRRVAPEPVLGAAALALAEGIRHAWSLGCELAVLGGGRSDEATDSLLAFKRQLAPTLLPRLTVETPGALR